MGLSFGGCCFRVNYSFSQTVAILPTYIPRTPEEVVAAMFEEDVTRAQGLPEANNMELFSEATYYTYWTYCLFSLVVDGQDDILAMCNPSKVRYIQKCKYEDTERNSRNLRTK